MGAPVTGLLKMIKGELDSNWCGCRIVNARCLETRIEIEGNGSDDSWEALELGCRKVQDRANHASILRIPVMKRIIRSLGLGMERTAAQVDIRGVRMGADKDSKVPQKKTRAYTKPGSSNNSCLESYFCYSMSSNPPLGRPHPLPPPNPLSPTPPLTPRLPTPPTTPPSLQTVHPVLVLAHARIP